jgi:hypothetical protein
MDTINNLITSSAVLGIITKVLFFCMQIIILIFYQVSHRMVKKIVKSNAIPVTGSGGL